MDSESSPVRVLLVEDDEDDYILVRDVLSNLPARCFELNWVKDYDSALDAVSLSSRDICILDYQLGGRNGLELLETIRREGCAIPVIVLTGKGSEEIDLLAMEAGADDYLEKAQITPSLLDRSIRYAIHHRERENALRESERRLRAGDAQFRRLFDQSPIGAAIVSLDYRLLKANAELCRIVGYSEQELLSMTFPDITYPEDLEADLREVRRILSGEIDQYSLEKRYIHKSGRLIWGRVSVRLIRDVDGKPLYFSPMLEDITRIKQAKELIRVQRDIALGLGSTSNFQEAMDLLLDRLLQLDGVDAGGVYTVDPEAGELHLVAHRGLSAGFVEDVSCYTADSLQFGISVAGEPAYWSAPCDFLNADILKREGIKALAVIPLKHEERVVASLNLASRTDDELTSATRCALEAIGAQIGGLIARLQVEDALKKSEEKYRAIFEGAPFGIIRRTLKGKSISCNPFVARMLGYESPEELLSTVSDIREFYVDPEDFRKLNEAVLEEGIVSNFETELRRRDGERIFVSLTVRGIRGGTGSIETIEGLIEDITARKRSETALRESEERFKTSIESMLDCFGIYSPVYNEKGEIVDFLVAYVNEAACAGNGMTGEEQIGGRLLDLFPGHRESGLFEEYRGLVETGKPLIKEAIVYEDVYGGRKLRRIFDIRAAKSGNGFVASWRDVTGQKRIQEELRMSEKKYRDLVENLQEGIWVIGKDGVTTFVNPPMAEMLGYTVEEMLGKHLFSFMDEQGVEACTRNLERREQGVREQHDFVFLRKNGSKVFTTLATSPVFTENGEYSGAIAGIVDITWRVNAETALKEAHDRLERRVEERTTELEETNVALRVLLKCGEEDKRELEEKIICNVNQMISPHIARMKNTRLDSRQQTILDLLETGLREIVSPFAGNLRSRFSNLTPMEMQVAELVRAGKTASEIAGILTISVDTVKFHKINMRRKFGLKNKKDNLKSFLQSIPKA